MSECNCMEYVISEQLKKIWDVEQGLLDEFVRVCEKNGLRYYLNGGTLLGAVRHKGFIPWDDDVDVCMPREDYDKLWEIAAEEFSYPFFFQTTLSEDGFYRPHAQLRNSDTTGFDCFDAKKPQINKGIFLDIFVLDGIPDGKLEYLLFRYFVKFQKALLSYEYDREFNELNVPKKAFYIFVHLFFSVVPFKKYFSWFNKKVLGHYRNNDTKRIADLTLQWNKNVEWDREWWSDTCLLEFKGKMYVAPKDYDQVLTRQYGDYMIIPNEVKANHSTLIFDPYTPYKDFQKGCEDGN